ncbi:hypothetical protein ACOYW6_08450 [Parablastomonas sp. CN1-191]|uniref:hypothetical protein n=1 Tax=Parablastomonas sp. CN1-191 TaxID=3400908 RepID=UPI003BF8BF03
MRNALILAAGTALAMAATPALADHHRGGDRNWSGRHCPPGLAKKHNGCMPPGQARKMYYNRGERVPSDWRYVQYNTLPSSYRDRYRYNDSYRYYYNDGRVYAVDPTTRLIQTVINILR